MKKDKYKSCFLDTSSLVKLYLNEDNWELRDKLSGNQIEKICLSEITKTEFSSAIYKKARQKVLTVKEAEKIINDFKSSWDSFIWQKVDSEILEKAESFVQKYYTLKLKSLDSIQLVSAITLKEENRSKFFISHDNVLCNIFGREKLQPI